MAHHRAGCVHPRISRDWLDAQPQYRLYYSRSNGMGVGDPPGYHEHFDPAGSTRPVARACFQHLSVGAARRGAFWQPAGWLDGTELGAFTNGAGLWSRLPDCYRRDSLDQSTTKETNGLIGWPSDCPEVGT